MLEHIKPTLTLDVSECFVNNQANSQFHITVHDLELLHSAQSKIYKFFLKTSVDRN